MIKGIDVSHFNNPNTVRNYKHMIDFVVVKASEGRTFADTQAPTFAEEALRNDLLLGFYHYARPENNCPEVEADNFLSRIQSYVDARKCFLALDWEGKALLKDPHWAREWLDIVYKRTGIKPMLYVQESAVEKMYECAKGDYGLWIAKWERGATINDLPLRKPKTGAWKFYAIHQYTDTKGTLDVNLFNGSREQLKKYM